MKRGKQLYINVLAIFCGLLFITTSSQAAAPVSPDVCKITGTVIGMQRVANTPWPGVPVTFAEASTEVIIQVNSRSVHRKMSGNKATTCTSPAKTVTQTYKLCSRTPIKRGDVVQGVEGIGGSKGIKTCLFDLVVAGKK